MFANPGRGRSWQRPPTMLLATPLNGAAAVVELRASSAQLLRVGSPIIETTMPRAADGLAQLSPDCPKPSIFVCRRRTRDSVGPREASHVDARPRIGLGGLVLRDWVSMAKSHWHLPLQPRGLTDDDRTAARTNKAELLTERLLRSTLANVQMKL